MAALTDVTEGRGHVTRDDIEAKLRSIRGEVEEVSSASKIYVVAAGALALTALVGTAYLLGRRRGKKRTTIVEVRRV
jgi:hypothetical protein